MARFVLHLAAVVLFVVAAIFGGVTIEDVSIEQLDLVAGGLALWAASSLSAPPSA